MKNILLNTFFVLFIFVICTIDGIAQKNTVLIAYHSVNGHTAQMAKAIQKGIVESSDIKVIMKPANEVSTQELLDASAII
ncbi:MAG: hypothetical protein ACK5EI_07615, partial [Bacteroidota bacterium]